MSDTLVRPPRRPPEEPVAAEDPRLARRRRAVEEATRRRRRRVLAVVAAVVAVVVAAAGLTRTPLLDVDRVTVSGTDRVDRARVLRAADIGVGDPIIDVDAAAVRRRVMDVPGVASAAVEVRWPSAVAVRVTEEQPLARLVLDGGQVEVARGGRVLGRPGAGAGALVAVRVEGVAARDLRPGDTVPGALGDALVVLEQMPADLARRLPSATLDRSGSLSFTIADGGTVRFGPPEDVPAKVLTTATMLSGAVELACLDVLDVREPTRPTISRRGGCVVPAPTVGATTTTTPRSTTKPPTTGTTRGRATTTPTTTPRASTTTAAGRGR